MANAPLQPPPPPPAPPTRPAEPRFPSSSPTSPRPHKKLRPASDDGSPANHTGRRPVTSCTHCRQHKIKCNASDVFPSPCARCQRMNLRCEVNPLFKPQKGGQIQNLRNEVDELRMKIQFLQRNEQYLVQALGAQHNLSATPEAEPPRATASPLPLSVSVPSSSATSTSTSGLPSAPGQSVATATSGIPSATPHIPSSAPHIPSGLPSGLPSGPSGTLVSSSSLGSITIPEDHPTPIQDQSPAAAPTTEFILGPVRLPLDVATKLHARFMADYLPYLPILASNSPAELYSQSQLLFWTVCLTACLSDPDPSLYNALAVLIKQLAIETCWIRTPRSTHIVQALLILGTWPLPNQKVLDDCSYRFVGLAKSLALQLGLHRGKFINEFSRTQVSLPDAEKWRTRTWLAVFVMEQFWGANLGLPPALHPDHLIEAGRSDSALPQRFRSLLVLAMFQSKLVDIMGSSVSRPDGLMDPKDRAGSLAILDRELARLAPRLDLQDVPVEMYYLYVKLLVCGFSFLPETPVEDQTKYVTQGYHAATRVVTLFSQLAEKRQIIEYPIYVRQAVSYSALLLFRLHLTPYLLPQYVDSCRQSVVTVHRLLCNMLAAWKQVENDISRTAKVLEKLNFVIATCPDLFTASEGIIVRMRSHLSQSLFYELVWCVHEARRRTLERRKRGEAEAEAEAEAGVKAGAARNGSRDGSRGGVPNGTRTGRSGKSEADADANAETDGQADGTIGRNFRAGNGDPHAHSVNEQIRNPLPLPFYNKITKEDFTATTTTTPNGTTVTTLVPTVSAMSAATASATAQGNPVTQINGIPISMLANNGSRGRNTTETDQPSLNSNMNTNAHQNGNTNPNLHTNPNQDPRNGPGSSQALPMPSLPFPGRMSEPGGLHDALQVPPTPQGEAGRPAGSGESAYYNGVNAGTPGGELDTLMQSIDWIDGPGDDFLGWFDINMVPEF